MLERRLRIPHCGLTATTKPEVETLVQSTARGDIQSAVDLATKYEGSVVYDQDRNALLFFSTCTGDQPIGVQPLTASQHAAVGGALVD